MQKQMGKIQSGFWVGLVLTVAVLAGAVAFVLFDASGTKSTLGPEYTYDIKQYAEIDPALILYQQVGKPIETDFQNTNAIAVGVVGKIYIAGDEEMAIYSPHIPEPIKIGLDAEPTCIAVEQNGTMIVGVESYIVFIDKAGVETNRWKVSAENAVLTAIAIDKDNVFTADAVNKVIWRYDRKGTLLNKIGEKDENRNIPGIVVPSPYFDIATASDGLLRVVNPGRHLIEAYTVDGDREWVWGKASVSIEGFSGCCNPINFAILPDGGFVTCEKGLVRVKVYDADGNFTGVVAGPDQLGWIEPLRVCETVEQCSSKGFDVAVGSDGRIYILDMVRNNVRIFEKK